ncbi:MAG TPA: hypothetical protein VFA93_00960 [Patescibacteria group bacterium]|nr:hypothetical protein [Patescibacteria group bacterium]
MTTTIYKCSNKVCQADTNRKISERREMRKKQEKDKEDRAKLKKQQKSRVHLVS